MIAQTTNSQITIEMSGFHVSALASDPNPGRELPEVFELDPLTDPRWVEFIERHPRASVFHSLPWLLALSQTYGYKPVAYTTSAPCERLHNAIVFCLVDSWLTGRRLVSLPFSDHCEPLVDSECELRALGAAVQRKLRSQDLQYFECRPLNSAEFSIDLPSTSTYYTFHQLDLTPDLETLFSNCHKSSTQRKILRAEREGLTLREGSNRQIFDEFYRLQRKTRQKHGVPPQPRKWFAALAHCFGDALKIQVAYKDRKPIAAILTIRFKNTLIYKYGGSDPRFNPSGGMHFLLWGAIKDAKQHGLRFVDFGRTALDQQGLITFKSRWGAQQSMLEYVRFGASQELSHCGDLSAGSWKTKIAKYVFAKLPAGLLSITGQALYEHIG